MKLLSQKETHIKLYPGDSITITYKDKTGQNTTVLEQKIENPCIIDKIEIHKLENELGFESGYAAILGNKINKKCERPKGASSNP